MTSLEVPGRAIFQQAASRIETATTAGFPTKEVGEKQLSGLLDPWGNPLVYDLIDSTHVRISSAGPDRIPKTQWDIGLIIERVRGDSPSSTDTWLARRKAALGIKEQPSQTGFKRTEFSGGQSQLEGAAYFRFFTWLVLATTALFIPFAFLYRPKTYLHE
jgi:POT family proton-dependent oligopeptide transporter